MPSRLGGEDNRIN